MQTSTAASAIADTEQKEHQSNVEYGHCKADTIHCNVPNEASAVLTNLQRDARLIKWWNLQHAIWLMSTDGDSRYLSKSTQ